MSSTDAHSRIIVDSLKRIILLAEKSGRTLPLVVYRGIPEIDVVAWLASEESSEKWYWRSRDGSFEIAGIGKGFEISGENSNTPSDDARSIIELMGDDGPFFLTGRDFSIESAKKSTSEFPNILYAIPDRMIIRSGENYQFAQTITIRPGDDARGLIGVIENRIDRPIGKTAAVDNREMPNPDRREDFPDFIGWSRNIHRALDAIDKHRIEKIVLARRTDYKFSQSVVPMMLLRQLMLHNRNCYTFMHQMKEGTAFLSVTPERLFVREGRRLKVEAVSSTVPRGDNPDRDAANERELLGDDKLRREHQIVIDGIIAALTSTLQMRPDCGETAVMKLERIQHLYTPIDAGLDNHANDIDLINALHPTPAVGGLPSEAAVRLIEELEPFDRSWYAAPIGFMSKARTEIAVGIRSLMIRDNAVSVFTGAGIVAGSDAEIEWREIDSKDILQPLLKRQVMR